MSVPSLRWLQIHRYEQFDPVRIEFSAQENLILGINGAGKTRLLRLIRAVLSMDFGELREHPFDVEFELETVSWRDASVSWVIHGQVKNEVIAKQAVTDEYPTSVQGQETELRASLRYESAEAVFFSEVKNGAMAFRNSAGSEVQISYRGDGFLLPIVYRTEENGPPLREFLKRYPVCESAYVGEADHEFQKLTHEVEYSAVVEGERLISIDPAQRLGRLLVKDLYPLLFQVVNVMTRKSLSEGYNLYPFAWNRGADNALQNFERLEAPWRVAIGVESVKLVPKRVSEKGDLLECRGVGLRVRFADAALLTESELTFGQRRYLYAGMMLLSHRYAPILIDEVDNGMHPRLVETLLKLLAGRQCFLSSHNKIVIDYINFSGSEDVQRKIHIVGRGGEGRQSVLALDEETARTVYEKIAVAIQSPSDVLLAEGLW